MQSCIDVHICNCLELCLVSRWLASAPSCCNGEGAVCNTQIIQAHTSEFSLAGAMDLTCIGAAGLLKVRHSKSVAPNWVASKQARAKTRCELGRIYRQCLKGQCFAEARRQRHEARQQALVSNQPKGLPQHVLNNLSSFIIKNTDEHSSDDLDCTICQEDLCQEKASSLPCGHIFHKRCIRILLKRKATCPT